jgi:hypothetical protein
MESQASEARPILAAFSSPSSGREAIAGDIDDVPDAGRTIEHLRLDLRRRGRREADRGVSP